MNAKTLLKNVKNGIIKNAPTISTYVGIAGFWGTVILTARTAPKAKLIYEKKLEENPDMNVWEKTKVLAPLWWQVAVMGALSTGCLIYADKANLKRNAAAIAAYQFSETALGEFKEAAKKTVGSKKAEEMDAKVAEEAMRKNPASKANIIYTDAGEWLCYDYYSGRYFMSSKQRIEDARNEINRKLMRETAVSLNEFYDILGLDDIGMGDDLGWTANTVDDLLEFTYDSVLTDDGRPALVIRFDVKPLPDFYSFT